MGRNKIEIKKLNTQTLRTAKFKKRNEGVLKKASELATLCDVDVAVILFCPEGTPNVFFTKPLKDIVNKLRNSNLADPDTDIRHKQGAEKAAQHLSSMEELRIMKGNVEEAHHLKSMDELRIVKGNLEEALRNIDKRVHMLFPQQEVERTYPTPPTQLPDLRDPGAQIPANNFCTEMPESAAGNGAETLADDVDEDINKGGYWYAMDIGPREEVGPGSGAQNCTIEGTGQCSY